MASDLRDEISATILPSNTPDIKSNSNDEEVQALLQTGPDAIFRYCRDNIALLQKEHINLLLTRCIEANHAMARHIAVEYTVAPKLAAFNDSKGTRVQYTYSVPSTDQTVYDLVTCIIKEGRPGMDFAMMLIQLLHKLDFFAQEYYQSSMLPWWKDDGWRL